MDGGRQPSLICNARDAKQVMRDERKEVRRGRAEARAEKMRAGRHCFERVPKGLEPQSLLTAWKRETEGWRQVNVVLDSGAADSVCPKDMAPWFEVVDSDASRAGVYYTAANGGKLYNLGQTHIPIAMDNDYRTMATFQVADVSRPLMSVSKVCEMGNRVVFGAGGGYILNLETGATIPFETKDGIYVFKLWIPPLSESPFGRPR